MKSPALIVAVSTSMPQYRALYSQAKELGDYLLKKMDFKKLGTVRSSAFPTEVLVREDGLSTLPECCFYLNRGRRDVLLFTGDSSPADEQYEFANFLLEKAQEMGVGELFSVGARWADSPAPPESEPKITGFATDATGVSKLRKYGVKVLEDEPAPFFASMVVAMAKDYGIRGYKISVDHGEPIPHARSVAALLGVIQGMGGFDVDLEELKSKVRAASPTRDAGSTSIYH